MIESGDKQVSVYLCTFQIQVLSANIPIKFPCQYFVECKTVNDRSLAASDKYPSSNNPYVQFDKVLEIKTEMLFDGEQNKFYKKDIFLLINLISKSRSDQVKLVGRVAIDLAVISNNKESIYSEVAAYKLTYCSINADITFSANIVSKQLTQKSVNDLDKSSFNQYFSINPYSNVPFPVKIQNNPIVIENVFPTLMPKMESQIQPQPIRKNFSKIVKNDSSFRTAPTKKEHQYISSKFNDSLILKEHSPEQLLQKHKFKDQIDLNKKKISDLQIKISELCKTLQQSKTQMDKPNQQVRQIQQGKLISRQQNYQQNNYQIPISSLRPIQSTNPLTNSPQRSTLYNQKISQALQTQRLLQQNLYVIRQLQSTKTDLQKKVQYQKIEHQNLQKLYREKQTNFEQKVRSIQKQKKELSTQVDNLIKYKHKYQELNEQKNKLKEQYKEIEHELMRLRYDFNEKTQKNAEINQRLLYTEKQLERTNLSLKQLNYEKLSIQKQSIDFKINNEKTLQLLQWKSTQIQTLSVKIRQYQSKQFTHSDEFLRFKRLTQEQKRQVQQKLIQGKRKQQSLSKTIQSLQKSLVEFQIIRKENVGLKQQKIRSSIFIQEKQQIIKKKAGLIQRLQVQIKRIEDEKSMIQVQNKSFEEQITKIKDMLEESFHKKNQQNHKVINELKEQLRVSNSQYQVVMKQKQQLQDELEQAIENRQSTVSALQQTLKTKDQHLESLANSLVDKQNLIQMKGLQIQNMKSINENLSVKLEIMNKKELEMGQTIKVLQQQSQKILQIIEQKEIIDQQMISLKQKVQEYVASIQQLEEIIMQIKMQKQRYEHQLIQQTDHNQQNQQTINDQYRQIERLEDEVLGLKDKIYEFENVIDEISKQFQQSNRQRLETMKQLRQKDVIISYLKQDGNKSQINHIYKPTPQIPQIKQQTKSINQTQQKLILQNNQLKLTIKERNDTINHLKTILEQYKKKQIGTSEYIKTLQNDRESKASLTPERNNLNDELLNYTPYRSDRENISQKSYDIEKKDYVGYMHSSRMKSESIEDRYENRNSQAKECPKCKSRDDQGYISQKPQNDNQSSQLGSNRGRIRIRKGSLSPNRIKKQQIRQQPLEKQVVQRRIVSKSSSPNGKILRKSRSKSRSRSPPGKIQKNKRSLSPSGRIVKNLKMNSFKQNEINSSIRKDNDLKRLFKQLKLLNFQISALRNIYKQKDIANYQIKIVNRPNSEASQPQEMSMMEDSNSKERNFAERSYLIRKNGESHDIKKFETGHEMSSKQFLQTKYNISSRQEPGVLNELNMIKQRVLNRLQNTPNFSFHIQDQSVQFLTSIPQLKEKVFQLQSALLIIDEQKKFLQNQFQMFQQEKFYLNSDLNIKQIEVFSLYRSMIYMRQQMLILKNRNQIYLKVIQDYENNNDKFLKEKSPLSRFRSSINFIELSHISFKNDGQPQSQYDYLIKKHYQGQQNHKISMFIDKPDKSQPFQNDSQKCIKSLHQQIITKQQILMDQNQKLYDQQMQIMQQQQRISKLQTSIQNMSQQNILDGKESKILTNMKNSMQQIRNQDLYSKLLYENKKLFKQNQNLKQQLNFLSHEIDRLDLQFSQVNQLLFEKQGQIAVLKRDLQHANSREQQVLEKQRNLASREQTLAVVQMNNVQLLNSKFEQVNSQRMRALQQTIQIESLRVRCQLFRQTAQDVQVQYDNLKTNVEQIIRQLGEQKQTYMVALLESMQKNIQGLARLVDEGQLRQEE